MDNKIVSSILHGCKLARDLETNLPNLATHPDSLSDSCQQIIRAFSDVREQLINYVNRETNINIHGGTAGSSSFYSRAMETMSLFQAQQPPQQIYIRSGSSGASTADAAAAAAGMAAIDQRQETGSTAVDVPAGSVRRPMEMVSADHAVNYNGTITRASSSQRPRRRKDEGDRRTIQVAVPQYGNIDIPPDDGFTWKKYGQKEILGSLYPRSYYRCTHQKLYNCPAKKQVQRLDSDPFTYEVTYRGLHTCHLSATAPAVLPPQQPPPPPPPPSSSSSLQPMGQWLSMDFSTSLGGINIGTGSAGPSTAREDHHQYPLVADMANTMFNSGSSSTNSMDLIFSSSMEDDRHPVNWEAASDNKND